MIPRINSFVKLDPNIRGEYYAQYTNLFGDGTDINQRIIFLGEIPQMPGHCIIISSKPTGVKWTFHVGFHTENFVELTEDEI